MLSTEPAFIEDTSPFYTPSKHEDLQVHMIPLCNVLTGSLSAKHDLDALARDIVALQERNDAMSTHDWSSRNEDTEISSLAAAKAVHEEILDQLASSFGFEVAHAPSPWAQVHYKGYSSSLHTHTKGHSITDFPMAMSVAIHIKYPQHAGRLVFINSDSHICYPVNSSAGTWVAFPQWLMHQVTRNQSDEPRVSMSFNVQFAAPTSSAPTRES